MSVAALAGLRFAKMHGAGNDFIMIDARDLTATESLGKNAITALCDRRMGIGADGLIIVGAAEHEAVSMVYYNADGGRAAMCGNGARCAVSFAHCRGMFGAAGSLDTDAGRLAVRVHDPGDIEIALPPFGDLRLDCDLDIDLEALQVRSVHACNTGVPHLVLLVDDLDAVDVQGTGPAWRSHPRLGLHGANVNWIARGAQEGTWRLRTYERGVEAETLACGTGAAAAAVVLAGLDLARSPVAIQTASGDLLHIAWEDPARALYLRGPAVLVFEGEVSGDA